MSVSGWIGYSLFAVVVLLYPPVLLAHYIRREFVYFKPYLYGLLGGVLFYGLPWQLFTQTANAWRADGPVWMVLGALALVKGLAGEGAKRAVSTINNRTMFKWRHYLPLGIGFAHALLLALFGPAVWRWMGAAYAALTGGAAADQAWRFLPAADGALPASVLLVLGAVHLEIGTTVLNGLSRNKRRIGYWFAAAALSALGVLGLAWPFENMAGRALMGVLAILVGLFLVVRNRDAFSKFISERNSFRGF